MKILLLSLVVLTSIATTVSGQSAGRRDSLTTNENDLVQESKSPVERVQILTKAVDRRLAALSDPNTARPEEPADFIEKFGEFPMGSRSELLGDVVRIINEASDYLNELATREPYSRLMIKAAREFVGAAERWQPKLEAMKQKVRGEETNLLNEALEKVQEIIESGRKLPDGA